MESTLCALFQETVARQPDDIALRSSDGEVAISWRDYGERVRRIAAGLAKLGVRRGDTVAIMLTNRPEFHLIDTAAMHLGAVPFSIYNTSSPEQISYLFSNAGNKIVICEQQFRDRVADFGGRIVCVEDESLESDGEFDFDAAWQAVRPTDLLTIIYTSGTTGPPKGVELTHAATLFSVHSALGVKEFSDGARGGRVISYLPDAHLANRWFSHYCPMATGATVTTVRDTKTIAAVLTDVRPTVFLGVPALWYKLKAAVEQGIAEQTGLRKKIATWAMSVGREWIPQLTTDAKPSFSLRTRHAIADRLVLSQLRQRIGMDQVLAPITGAAPISLQALEFAFSLGLPLAEGWAMTELSVTATINRAGGTRLGTVGTAFDGVEIRLADDGELLVRTPGMMRGYRNDPAKTAETIDPDGWLHTGDIGRIDADGFVSIVDRKKELIINAAGKNMSPANIEDTVRVACPQVGSIIAIGDRRPYVVALVTIDPDAPAVADARATVQAAIDQANERLSRVEQIKKFAILPGNWQPGSDELTPTLKLRRRIIAEKYAREIDQLYTP